jgi:hypothetical protein
VDWTGRSFSREAFRFLSDAQPAAPGRYYRGYDADPAEVLGGRSVVAGAGFLLNRSAEKLTTLGENSRAALCKAWEYRKTLIDLVGRVPCFPDRTSLRNLETGFYSRLGSHLPEPDSFAKGVFQRVEAMYMSRVRRCSELPTSLKNDAVEYLRLHPEYTQIQKREVLESVPLIENCIRTRNFSALISRFRLSTFPKVEEYGPDKIKAVRHIVCPDVVFRFVLALLTKRLEEAFVQAYPRAWVKHLDDDGKRRLMVDVLTDFALFGETDFTTMEQNVKGIYRDAEMERFKYVFQGHWLEPLAEEVFTHLGTHFSLIKSKYYAFINHMCRNSGEGPTSVGNGSFGQIAVTSAMAIAAYTLERGNERDSGQLTNFLKAFEPMAMWNTGISEGDDGIFGLGGVFSRRPPEEVKAAMDLAGRRLGLLLKFDLATDYRRLHFCRNTLSTYSMDLDGRPVHGYLLKPTLALLDKLFLRHDSQVRDSTKKDVELSVAAMHSFAHCFWMNPAVRKLAKAYRTIFPKEWGHHFQMLRDLRAGVLQITPHVRDWLGSLWGHEEIIDEDDKDIARLIDPVPGSAEARRLEEIGNTVSAGLAFAWDESAALTDEVVDNVIKGLQQYAKSREEGHFEPVPVLLPHSIQMFGVAAERMRDRVVDDVRSVTSKVVDSHLAHAARDKIEMAWQRTRSRVSAASRVIRLTAFAVVNYLLFFAPYSILVGGRVAVSLLPGVAALPPPVITLLAFFLVIFLFACFFAGFALYCRILLGPRGGWWAMAVSGVAFAAVFGVFLWTVWPAFQMVYNLVIGLINLLDDLELPRLLRARDESRWRSVPRFAARVVFETVRGIIVGAVPRHAAEVEEEDEEIVTDSAERIAAAGAGIRPLPRRVEDPLSTTGRPLDPLDKLDVQVNDPDLATMRQNTVERRRERDDDMRPMASASFSNGWQMTGPAAAACEELLGSESDSEESDSD